MSTLKIILKNTGWQLFANILNKLFSLILLVYLARGLGEIEFGKYSFANSFIQIFIVMADLGLSLLTIREVAKENNKASKYLGNFTILKILLSLCAFSAIIVIINLLPYPASTVRVVYVLSVYFIFTSLSTFFRCIMNAFEKMEYDATLSLFEKFITVALCFIFLKSGYGLIPISYAFLTGGTIGLIMSFVLVVKKFVKPDFHIDLSFWKVSLKDAFPFALGSVFVMIYSYIDQVMLSLMKGDAAVGWYNASFSLVNNVTILASVFMSAAYPTFSRLFRDSQESLKVVYERSFKYLLILGLPIAVGGMILAERIIILLYGNEYLPSVAAFRILIWTAFPSHLCYLFSTFLNSINKQGTNLLFMIISTIANVLLNLILIPQFSYLGAGIATLLSEIILFFLWIWYLSRSKYRFLPIRLFTKVIAANGIMSMIILLLFKTGIIFLVAIGVIAYCMSLYALGCIDDEDRRIIKEILGK